MGSKLFLQYKKCIAILFVILSLTQTINLFAYANTFSVSDSISIGFVKDGKILRLQKSGDYSVAFGKSGQIVKSDKSKFVSVRVDSPSPVLASSGASLVNISPTIGVAPQVVTFDAKGVESEQGLTYLWDFGDVIARTQPFLEERAGDEAIPSEDSNQSTGATATHTYTTPGKYLVTLKVENSLGKSATYTKEIEIRDKNEPPVIDVAISVFETDDYKEVTFNASMSLDPEGDLISYTWESGDEEEYTGSIFTHRYSTKGTFVPKVTLTDALGAKTIKYIEPIEYLGPNIPPTPIADISPSTGYLSLKEDVVVIPSLLVKLSGKDSFDKDGEIINYKWTISGDKGQEAEVREGEEVVYEFNEAGVYKVTLEVTDNRGRVSTREEELTILKPDPVASASVDKTDGNAPLTVNFSSFGTRDFDGSLVNVRWNFGDDTCGVIASGSEAIPNDCTEPNPIHTYDEPGAYLATLTVETPDGRIKKTNTKTIIVAENNGPKGIISILEPVFLGIAGESSVKLSAKDSFDPKLNQTLSYKWSWIVHQLDKNKNLIDVSEAINKEIRDKRQGVNEEFSYTFTLPGQYIPILEVTAEDGRKNKVNGETITIVPSQNPVAIAQITSDKLSSEDTLTVNFDGSGSYDPKTGGNIVSYLWEFGDGNTSSEIAPVHTYNTPGTYNAKLTVQDSRGFTSTALTKTVEVVSSSETLARGFNLPEVKEKVLKLQELNSQNEGGLGFAEDEEKPKDNTPPQISFWVENPKLNAGEYLFFNAHVVDDIGIDEVGYELIDQNGNVISNELIPAPGNNHVDYYMANVNYRKEIEIPNDLAPGEYKLLLFAKDKADNWIGKTDSSAIISSEISVIGSLNSQSYSITEGLDEDTKPDAAILNEVEEFLSAVNSEEEKTKVIELTVADKGLNEGENENTSLARKYLKERNNHIDTSKIKRVTLMGGIRPEDTPQWWMGHISGRTRVVNLNNNPERNITLKEREFRLVRELGVPLQYGAPSSKNYTNVIKTEVSQVAPSTNGDYTTVSVQASLTPEVANNLASYDIEFLGKVQDPQNPEEEIIQSHLTIRCAADNDCTIYNDALSEINSPRVVITPVDDKGDALARSTETKLSKDKLDKNGPKAPTLTSIYPTSKQKGQGAFRLVVVGEDFNEKSKIYFGDNELETNYVTPELLYAYVPAWFTISAKKIGIKVRKKAGGKVLTSNTVNFDITSKSQSHFVFSTENDLSQEILGNNLTLERFGGNIYIDNSTTVFKEAGEIVIPLSITSASNLTLEIKGSLISTEGSPVLNLYHNNALVKGLLSSKSTTNEKSWKVNIGKLPPGAHSVKLTVPDLDGKTLFVLNKFVLNFESASKPKVKNINPNSIYPNDILDRKLTITGENFGTNPKVYYKGQIIASENNVIARSTEGATKQSPNEVEQIIVTLPSDLGLLEGQKYINIQVLNSETGIYSENTAIELRSDLKVNTVNANYSFISNALDPHGRLDIDVNTTNNADTVYIGVYGEDGNIIRDPYSIGKTNVFSGLAKAKFTLPYDLKEGTYYVLALAKRNAIDGKEDYSNIKVKELFDDLLEDKITSKEDFLSRLQVVSDLEKATFPIGVNLSPVVTLFGAYNVNGTQAIQENKKVTATVNITGNKDTSNLNTIIDFGDGTVYTNVNSAEHTYMLSQSEKFKEYAVFATVFEDGAEIANSQAVPIIIYKDLPPVAIANVDTENYEVSGDAPFKTGFIDKSYDPNDEITNFSGVLDKVIPENNTWRLIKYTDGITGEKINQEDLTVSGSQVLSGGKSFVTGEILRPGTYYANLTAVDTSGKSDSTQSETVQVTLPTQKLLVYASFMDGSVIASEGEQSPYGPVFEYNTNGEVNVQFDSLIDIRSNKQPKNIIYSWDFGDDTCGVIPRSVSDEESRSQDCSSPNPLHVYKKANNTDTIDYHPELTVTAIWKNGYSESWSSKAGTISIIDKPEFVALDFIPETTIGNAPLTVNFMVGENSIAKNSIIESYEFYAYVIASEDSSLRGGSEEPTKQSPTESGVISNQSSPESALEELKQKTFTFTYATQGEFNPKLVVKTQEGKEFTFNSPAISTNQLLISGIEVLDPSNNHFTNDPIQTFSLSATYINPLDIENRLTLHLIDEDGIETITELSPNMGAQTVSLNEGLNTYWFELIDSTGAIEKSESRNITLDITEPSLSDVSVSFDETNASYKLTGNLIEKNLQKVELIIDGGVPVILSSSEASLIEGEIDEYAISKTLENLAFSNHTLELIAYDLGGNIAKRTFELSSGNSKVFLTRKGADENIVSNKLPDIGTPEKLSIQKDVISGKPFNIELYSCFSDDLNKSEDNVEAKFDISSIKLSSISFNGENLNLSQDDLGALYVALLNSHSLGCINLASIAGGTLVKKSCDDAYADGCRNTCVHLDGPACNIPVLFSKNLNTYTNSLFNPMDGKLNPLNSWDIGSYVLKFEISENQATCSLYGTCLGKDFSQNKTQATYTFTVNVKRNPEAGVKNIKTTANNLSIPNGKLIFNTQNDVTFKVVAKDNLPYTSVAPNLKLNEAIWEGINNPPELKLVKSYIDENDPRKYIFELSTSFLAKNTNPIHVSIPVDFPGDYFNTSDIRKNAEFDLKVITNIDAVITSPPAGWVLSDKTQVTAKVNKPEDLPVELSELASCKKSEIFYGLKKPESTSWLTLQKAPAKKGEKVISRGVSTYDGGLEYSNLINFNLKNNAVFKKSFLNGTVLGLIELAGEYSTACDSNFVSYSGESKPYVLVDKPDLKKTKCTLPNGSEHSKCSFVVSNNTLLDKDYALKLKVIPNIGEVDPSCTIPDITFEKENKLTKKVTIDCLPKEATSFEIKLERNPKFLNKIQEEINNSGLLSLNLSSVEEAVVADRVVVEVENAIDEEEFFTIGDPEDKRVSFNYLGDNRSISVSELRTFLEEAGYGILPPDESGEFSYTQEVENAFRTYIGNFETALQRLDNEFGIGVNISENGEISYTEVSAVLKNQVTDVQSRELGKKDLIYVELSKDFLLGLKDGGVNEVNTVFAALQEPEAIMFVIATSLVFVGLSASTVFLTWLPMISTALLGVGIGAASVDAINQSITYYIDEKRPSNIRLFGFVTGKLVTATIALDGILKIVERLVKSRWLTSLIKNGKLTNYERVSNLIDEELKSLDSIIAKEERIARLNQIQRFGKLVDSLTDSGKRVLDDVIKAYQDRSLDTNVFIQRFGGISEDANSALVRIFNREGFIVSVTELDSQRIVFILSQLNNIELESKIILVVENLAKGKQTAQVNRAIKVLSSDTIDNILAGNRTIANTDPKQTTFVTFKGELEGFTGGSLIKRLGLDTPQGILRFQNKQLQVLEFDLGAYELKLADGIEGGANENLVLGGITSGGAVEGVLEGGPLATKITDLEQLNLNASRYNIEFISFSENEIRSLLKQGITMFSDEVVEETLATLRAEERL